MKNTINQASDTLYNVQGAVEKLNQEYPNESIIVAAASKARRTDDENKVGAGLGWATARRAPLILTDTAFYCGDWRIPLDKLKYAEYVVIPSVFGFKTIVIKIADNDGNHYQFGVIDMEQWLQQDLVTFKREEPVVWYSAYVWIMRIFLLAALVYYLLSVFQLLP